MSHFWTATWRTETDGQSDRNAISTLGCRRDKNTEVPIFPNVAHIAVQYLWVYFSGHGVVLRPQPMDLKQ